MKNLQQLFSEKQKKTEKIPSQKNRQNCIFLNQFCWKFQFLAGKNFWTRLFFIFCHFSKWNVMKTVWNHQNGKNSARMKKIDLSFSAKNQKLKKSEKRKFFVSVQTIGTTLMNRRQLVSFPFSDLPQSIRPIQETWFEYSDIHPRIKEGLPEPRKFMKER